MGHGTVLFSFSVLHTLPREFWFCFSRKGGRPLFSISKAFRRLAMAKSRKNKQRVPPPGARSLVWPDHIISSEEDEPVARESRDARTLDVIIREIVRGRPANIRGREALLIGDLSAHLY
jgi:hypothetical protein